MYAFPGSTALGTLALVGPFRILLASACAERQRRQIHLCRTARFYAKVKPKEEVCKMRKLSRLAFAALIALADPAGAEDGVTETEIVLGSHTALSSPVSAWGVGSTEGTRMRFDEANEKGIHGRKIKFVVED